VAQSVGGDPQKKVKRTAKEHEKGFVKVVSRAGRDKEGAVLTTNRAILLTTSKARQWRAPRFFFVFFSLCVSFLFLLPLPLLPGGGGGGCFVCWGGGGVLFSRGGGASALFFLPPGCFFFFLFSKPVVFRLLVRPRPRRLKLRGKLTMKAARRGQQVSITLSAWTRFDSKRFVAIAAVPMRGQTTTRW